MQSKNLFDLEYIGNPFIWYNKRKAEGVIFSRFDHAIANYFWIKVYLNATLKHLPIICSDHGPIVLNMSPNVV